MRRNAMSALAMMSFASIMMSDTHKDYTDYDGNTNPRGGNIKDAIEQEKKRKKIAEDKQKEINKANGLKQWSEYGYVWAATKKAAIKKYKKQNKSNQNAKEI